MGDFGVLDWMNWYFERGFVIWGPGFAKVTRVRTFYGLKGCTNSFYSLWSLYELGKIDESLSKCLEMGGPYRYIWV